MWWFAEAAVAWAGACCVGSTSAIPGRLGECEHVLVGAGVGGEAAVARWDPAGAVAQASPNETSLLATGVVGGRWSRWGQASLQLPTRWSWRSAGTMQDQGGGVGDLVASVTVDPFEEGLGPRGGGWPVPVLTLAVRAPTGRDWTEASGPLLADVTGAEGLGGRGTLSFERSMGTVPWWVATDLGVDPQVPARLGLSGGVGHTLGTDWTVAGTLRHEHQLAATGSSRTSVGGRLVHGRRLAWRAWLGAGTDLPLPGVGADAPVLAAADLGVAWVH